MSSTRRPASTATGEKEAKPRIIDANSAAAELVSPLQRATEKSNISPAVPTSTIVKLLVFTALMFIVPISSYFITVDRFFNGNSSQAGGFAAVMANIVLVGYIVAAIFEDVGEPPLEHLQKIKKDE